MKGNTHFSVSIALVAAFLICFIGMPCASAESQYTTYSLQGQQVIDYSQDRVTLANGSIILLDIANITEYLPQITQASGGGVSGVSAYDTRNYINYLNTTGNFSVYDPVNATRIQQGDCVTLGQTLDIAGIGWYTGVIAYYGKYYDGYSADYDVNRVALYKIEARNLKKFYVDPDFFSRYPGWWYVYYHYTDNESTRVHGNDRLFYIGNSCESPNITSSNHPIINLTELYATKARLLSELPEKKENGVDFIISRNLTSVVEAPPNTRLWVFGRQNYNYDQINPDNSTKFFGNVTANWEPGIYNAVYIFPDGNGLYDERYSEGTQTIISPFIATHPVYIGDLQPRLVYKWLIPMIENSYSKFYVDHRVYIQDPSIEVVKLDNWRGWENASLVTLAGYTNANPGDKIIIEMDKEVMGSRESERHTWVTRAWGNMSSYRIWNTTFVFNTQNENPGQHSMTISSDNGASASVPFYIYKELPKHYIPENYIQYINNSPFIPPVIQTVTIPVPGPTQIVYVDVTPSQESVNEAQRNAISSVVLTAVEYVVIGIAGLIFVRYVIKSLRRRKWFRK